MGVPFILNRNGRIFMDSKDSMNTGREDSDVKEPTVIKGEYRWLAIYLVAPAMVILILLLVLGAANIIHGYLDISSSGDWESKVIYDILGPIGLTIVVILGTGYLYITEDREFVLKIEEGGFEFTGKLPFRADRKIVLDSSAIDEVMIERPDYDENLFRNGYLVTLKDSSRPFSLLDPRAIKIWSDGLDKDGFIQLCEAIKQHLVIGRREHVDVGLNSTDELSDGNGQYETDGEPDPSDKIETSGKGVGDGTIIRRDDLNILAGSLDDMRSIIEKNIAEGKMKLRS